VADVPATKPLAEGQLMTVFRSRRRAESESAYQRLFEELQDAARSVPGFVDFKSFVAEDGERVSLVTFANLESHQVWRNDPRHRMAMKAGREEFYCQYSVQVGECTHVSEWTRDSS